MKYFKDENGEVHAFAEDGSEDGFIQDSFTKMTKAQVNRHLFPEEYLTKAQKQEMYLKTLRPLTRRQFMLALVEYELDDDLITAIENIEDVKQRKTLSIEYKDAQTFPRFNESVLSMLALLNLDDQKINEMWEHGLSL